MKNLKSIIKTTLTLALAAAITASMAGCGGTNKDQTAAETSGKTVKVAIVQPMSHTSLDQIRETIISELENSGYDFEIAEENANGDTSALSTILENVRTSGADIVVPIATSTAQSAKAVFDSDRTPIVFSAVSDPDAAGLTGSDCENITGVSNNIPAAEIVKLISNFQPDYQKIGFLYTSSETNSVSTINAAKAYCDENGIAYEETSIANLSELQTAAETLISKGVDALYTGNDNSIASAMSTYTDAAYAKNIPIYCGADSMVADGGFATTGVDYVQLGRQTADIVERIAGGEEPSSIPYETLTDYAKFVNLQAADAIGIELTDAMLDGFNVLVEADGTSHFGE